MENQNKQKGLFTEQDFEPRDVEQELMKSKANLENSQLIGYYTWRDCFYYLGAGNCVMHRDTTGCMDCDDYKSVFGDDIEDEDIEDDD